MQTTVEETGGLGRKVRLEIPAARIDDAVKDRMKSLRGQVRLNGFRPGKVPLSVIQQRYGEPVREEVSSELIQEGLGKAIEDNELRPVQIEDVDRDGGAAGEDLVVTAEFDVFPAVELKGLENIAVNKVVVDIEDSDIDEAIQNILKGRAEHSDVERAAADGDRVIVDFVGTIDGEEFDGGKAEQQPVDLGSGSFLPDFEAALVGVSAGDEKTFDVAFPEDYGSEALAGKTAQFAATVHKVQAAELPELTDELVVELGIAEGGIPALREAISGNMRKQAEERFAADVKQQVMDGLYEASAGFDLPAALVKSEVDRIKHEQHAEHDHAPGEACDHEDLPDDELTEQANKRVALGLLVAEVSRERDIKADPNLVNERLMGMIGMHPQAFELFQQYRQDERVMRNLETMVLEDQVVASLVETGAVVEEHRSYADVIKGAA